MKYKQIKEIKVSLELSDQETQIGRLAINDKKIYFQYHSDFINSGVELSPLKLPLQSGLQTFDPFLFSGLPGLFYDSLPDGWGRLLLDRTMRMQGILPEQLSPLDRLAYVGKSGMGALVYQPAYENDEKHVRINLDRLAINSQAVLDGKVQHVLPELLSLNGSSAGARPKAMICVDKTRQKIIHGVTSMPADYEPWLVKFSNSLDGKDAGAIEYVYALMAKDAGLTMTETHLFPADNGAGYFATKRFDRDKGQRVHTHSVCGLLHSDFRAPSLDYQDLLSLTHILTRDIRQVEKMFQMAVFNVLSHNRDDHAKNFSFLLDVNREWKLSPAYDLTFSSGPNGEQSTMVMGEGKNPRVEHLIQLGADAKLKKNRIIAIIQKTQYALSQWIPLAKQYGVSQANIKLIEQKLLLPT